MIGQLLDHPLWCAFAVTIVGFAVAALALWPSRGGDEA